MTEISNPPVAVSKKQIPAASIFYGENLRNQSWWLNIASIVSVNL